MATNVYTSTEAMVVSARIEASKIGVDILQQGGNAIDAAVAVQMALAVVHPQAGNLGGGGFMIYRNTKKENFALDFREKAPMRAHKNMYLDADGNPVPNLSLDGALAAGVPGTVAACEAMHQRWGKLPWKTLIQPAIDLAQNGFPLSAQDAELINKFQEKFEALNTQNYFANASAWKAGDVLKQSDLAQTLTRIRDFGAADFYTGKTAELIVSCMQQNGGWIAAEDLKSYSCKWRTPLVGTYKNYTIITMPPPSSGGIVLLQIAKMLEKMPWQQWQWQNAEVVHATVEAERRAYADRAVFMGDPDFVKVPVVELLDTTYLNQRMANFSPQKANTSAEIAAGTLPNFPQESEETTHFSIVDAEGNAVSLTTTLNSNFGAKTFVAGAGFLLNNEMDDFSIKPGVPNQFGLVGNEANAIAPEKRMLSSMTPTIVTQNDALKMVLGTPGGSTIITSVWQVFANVFEFGMNMQEAVNKARFHHQWLPDVVYMEENAFSANVLAQLQAMGYKCVAREPIGRVDAILVKNEGTLEAGADQRGDDAAWGY
ncbi:MAG: gamma-glutamyltransferase [Chitinophagales bacterium]